jgi:hypothetical protein
MNATYFYVVGAMSVFVYPETEASSAISDGHDTSTV